MRKLKSRHTVARRATALAVAIQMAFNPAFVTVALAGPVLPQGAAVVNGQVAISNPSANALQINASSGAIVNWQKFSIGAGGQVQIGLPSASSAMLNRVVGGDASQILGSLQSNGRVFLINPNGIVVGAGARIDTNSFIASTLDMSDGDFLAGKLRFLASPGAGSIRNDGVISVGPGGRIALIAPDIQNTGIIQAPGGQILLAAGRKLEISSLDFEGVTFEIQAPTDSVLNLGKLLADNGAVSVFAGSLRHSGEIRANKMVQDGDGSIRLLGSNEVTLTSDSVTRTDGLAGGAIKIQSTGGTTRVAGVVSAVGSDGKGGDIQLLGERVAVESLARLDASGSGGGGQILVGGDFQGANSEVQNASRVYVAPGASLKADATDKGDGGKVVVWADENTRYYGDLSVRGGPNGGNGGKAEVSGKANLAFDGTADLGAPAGQSGSLLLDPLDILVSNAGGILPSVVDQFTDFAGNVVTISPVKMATINGTIVLQANRDIYFMDPVALTIAGAGLSATAGGPAFNSVNGGAILMNQSISTNAGAVTMRGVSISGAGTITTTGGGVDLATSGNETYSSAINSGGGTVNLASTLGFVNSANVNAGTGSIQVIGKTGVFNGVYTTTGIAGLTATAGSVNGNQVTADTVNLSATGGSVSGSVNATSRVNAASSNSSVQLNNLAGQALRLGTLSGSSGVFLTSNAGFEQASGGLITAPFFSVSAGNSAVSTGSAAAPLTLALPALTPDIGLTLQGIAAPAFIALTGAGAPLSSLSLTGTVAGLGATSITGATNLTTLALANGGTVLGANAVSTGGLASGFQLNVTDGGLSSTTLNLAGAPVTLNSQGAMTLGNVTGASLNASAAGPVTIGTATTTGNSGIIVNAQKCNLSFSVCTDSSPITAGTLTAGGFGSIQLTSRDNGDITATNLSAVGGSVLVNAGSLYANSSDRGPNFNKRFVTTGNINLGTVITGSSFQAINNGAGNITISNPATAGGSVFVQAGRSYNHDGNNSTPNVLTPSIINVAGLTGTSVNITDNGTGAITSTGNLAATSSSLSVSALDGPVSAMAANTSQSSSSFSSSTGSVSLGTVATVNSNAAVSVSAATDIAFQSITAPGATANVNLSASQGSIKATLDNPTADISTGGNVTLTATNGTNGVIGDASFVRPLDILAGAAKTVTLSAGKNIGDVGKAVHIDTNGSVSASTTGGQFFVSVDDLAGAAKTLTSIALSASAAGVGNGGTSTFASQNLSVNATSDGSAITIGDVVQAANRLDKFSFTSAGSGLNFGNVALTTATGFNQLSLSSNGPMTQATPGTNNIVAGRLNLNSGGGDMILGNVTSTSPTISSAAIDNSITLSGGNITTRNLLGDAITVSGANLVLGNGVTTDSVKTTGTHRSFSNSSFDSTAGQYPLDELTLNASGTLSTAWNVTSATTARLTGNGVNIGGAGTVTGGGYIDIFRYIDTVAISSGAGGLASTGAISAADVTVTGAVLSTGAANVAASRVLSFGDASTSNITTGTLTSVNAMTLNSGSFASGNIAAGSGSLNITANATGSRIFAPSISMNAGNTTITADNGINLGSNLTAPNVTLRAATGDINGNLQGTSNLTLNTGGKFAVTSTAALTNLDVSADGVAAGAGGGSSVNSNGANQSMTVVGPAGALAVNWKSNTGIFEYYRESSAAVTDMTASTTGSLGAGSNVSVTAPTANITTPVLALTNGSVQLSTGGDLNLTSINTGSGNVDARTSGGTVNLTSVVTNGGSVVSVASGANKNINVEKVVTLGGSINLVSSSGSILKAGSQPLQIDMRTGAGAASGTLTLNAASGNVGTGAAPLLTSGAQTLDVRAKDEIAIDLANTPLTNLSVTTGASGAGAIAITNSNYGAFSLTRAGGTDLVLSGVSPTVVGAFSLTATNGNIKVASDISNVNGLTLSAGSGDVVIQAGGGPRSVTSSGNVSLQAGNDILIAAGAGATESVSVVGNNFSANAGRDFSLLGGGASAQISDVGGFNTQSFSAGRDLTFAGGGGTNAFAAVQGSANTFQQTFNAGRTLSLHGGTGAGAYSKVTQGYAFGSQSGSVGNFSILGGDAAAGQGAGAYAEMSGGTSSSQQFNIRQDMKVAGGTATGNSALLSAGSSQSFGSTSGLSGSVTNSVSILGGSGGGAFARVVAGSSQNIGAAKDRFDAAATGDIIVAGGSGLNASAELTSGSSQSLGSQSNFCSFNTCLDPTHNILVQGGVGDGAFASVKAVGSQTVKGSGNISVVGSSGIGANAEILSTGAGQSQDIGDNSISSASPTQSILVQAGSGGTARIQAGGQQTLRAGVDISVLGGSGVNMTASIESTGGFQTIGNALNSNNSRDAGDNIVVSGGSANGAAAWIKAATGQTIDTGKNIIVVGNAPGAYAEIVTTAGSQSIGNLNSTFSFDQTDLIALQGGNGANAGARIASGGNQTIRSSNGISIVGGAGDGSGAMLLSAANQNIFTTTALNIVGGSGTAPGLNETGVRNSTSGSQFVQANTGISITGGGFGSDTWIKQQAVGGAQTVTTAGALTLQAPIFGAGITSIEAGTGGQTLSVGDVINLSNAGGNNTRITSGANQAISADAMSITLGLGSGAGNRAEVSAVGNQTISLVGGATPATLTVANYSGTALSSARLTAGGTQTIGMNYFNAGRMQIGDVNALGESLVQSGGNQTVVVGDLLIQGGASAAAKSKLQAGTPTTGAMLISTLNGPIQVLGGGAGPALIDPLTLDGISNGSILIVAGPGSTSAANVTAGSINMAATNGNMLVIGGGAPATVAAANTFNLAASGGLTFTPNNGGASISAPNGGNIILGGPCVGCATGLIGPFNISAGADTLASSNFSNGNTPNLTVFDIFLALNQYDEYGDLTLSDDGTLISGSRRRGLNQCY